MEPFATPGVPGSPPGGGAPTSGRGIRPLRAYGRDLGAGFGLILLTAGATWWVLDLPATYPIVAVGLYLLVAVLLFRVAPVGLPSPGIGLANRITLLRATLVFPVAALAIVSSQAGDAVFYWWIIFFSGIAMSLDGLDGRIARRTDTSTEFGARFDMELDAFLILVLSVLVWQSGRVGAWVIAMGALRYAFVVSGRIWPALRGELPESFRRKTVCVVQGLALVLCLVPIIPGALASLVAAAALGLLVYSFGVDVRWLAGQSHLE